jgi:hypothetical protein
MVYFRNKKLVKRYITDGRSESAARRCAPRSLVTSLFRLLQCQRSRNKSGMLYVYHIFSPSPAMLELMPIFVTVANDMG